MNSDDKYIELLERNTLLLERDAEQRVAERKWNRIKLIILMVPAILFSAIYLVKQGSTLVSLFERDYVSYLELTGEISEQATFNAHSVNAAISRAMKDDRSQGLLLRVSSPGGSPTQSILIRDHLDSMKEKHPDKKVVVVAEELMASGAYLVGSGADIIYASPSSIVGSIGVIMEGWGFQDLIKRVEVEHRLLTAGINKARFHPLMDLTDADREKTQGVLNTIHDLFIDYVQAGRGDLLIDPAKETTFSGDYWLGVEAMEMGLVDKFGGIRDALDEEFGTQKVYNMTPQKPWYEKIGTGFAAQLRSFLNPPVVTFR